MIEPVRFTLYQREACPFCAKVRRLLTSRGVDFLSVNVPKVGAKRDAMRALAGVEVDEVPVLLDGERTIQGSEELLAHLRRELGPVGYDDPEYAFTRRLPGVSAEEAEGRVREALQGAGFGIVTELDTAAVWAKKLDRQGPPHKILGACVPQSSYDLTQIEPGIAALIPCNVVITEDGGEAVVSAADPAVFLILSRREELRPIVRELRAGLKAALASL